MVKEKVPKSQKSNRPGHERFKDLYAQTPTTPELAGRAPRQVAQSVTPTTSDGTTTTTTASNNTTAPECTPGTRTPLPKKTKVKKPKRSKKATKWSHVPSASDGEETHFESFENDAGAQLAVAKMKTRKLQWSRETIDEDVVDETDAGESFREEIGGSAGGTGYSTGGSAGSAGEISKQLPPLERTQLDEGGWEATREMTMEEPDAKMERKLLSPQPSPPKAAAAGPGSKEALKDTAKPVAIAMSPKKPMREKSPQKPKDAAKPKPQEATKREQKPAPPKEKTKREQRAAPGKAATPKKSSREKPKPAVAAAPVAAAAGKAPAPAAPAQPPAPAVFPVPAKKQSSDRAAKAPAPVPPKEEATKRETRPQTTIVAKSREPSGPNYRLAVRLMKILKRNNYLENALRFEEGERVRKHFEANGFAQPPPKEIQALLSKAIDFALETVLFRADDLDTQITNELRVFIIKKQEARASLLEVCLNRPDLMPNKWGGARMDAKRSKSSTKGGGGKRGWFASLFR